MRPSLLLALLLVSPAALAQLEQFDLSKVTRRTVYLILEERRLLTPGPLKIRTAVFHHSVKLSGVASGLDAPGSEARSLQYSESQGLVAAFRPQYEKSGKPSGLRELAVTAARGLIPLYSFDAKMTTETSELQILSAPDFPLREG